MIDPEVLLSQRKTLLKFEDVLTRIHAESDLNFEDCVVDLEKVRVVPNKSGGLPDVCLEVPSVGKLTLTDWSKKQLGALVGVRFDKWFDPEVVTAEEIQQELQRRFARTREVRKIRARRFRGEHSGDADGYCRAVLSPSYAPIDDVRIFDQLQKCFHSQVGDFRFMQDRLGTDFYDDRTSNYAMVSDRISLGPINREHPNSQVRRVYRMAEAEGLLPEEDWVYQGLCFRNSEVGYTALTVDADMFRLLCLNGAIISTDGGRILYRTHRAIDDGAIEKLLRVVFTSTPALLERNRKMVTALSNAATEDPVTEMLKFLERQKATKAFQEAAIEAYAKEPLANRYGVMQAIARAARDVADMNRRVELEELAGRYMAQAA